MAHINVYVPNDLAAEMYKEARRAKTSLSQFLVGLFRRRVEQGKGWKKNFFTKVIGGWHGHFPSIERDPPEERTRI